MTKEEAGDFPGGMLENFPRFTGITKIIVSGVSLVFVSLYSAANIAIKQMYTAPWI
jgi:hypothetical protein